MAHKQTLTIEFNAVDYPKLLEIFKQFQVTIKSKKHSPNVDIIQTKTIMPETKANAWQRIAQDDDMLSLANEGVTDYKKIIDNYETT